MAQLVERLVRNEEATSSNLVISTKRKGRRCRPFCLVKQPDELVYSHEFARSDKKQKAVKNDKNGCR